MRCPKCYAELPTPTAYCLHCGNVNALACGIHCNEKLYLIFIGNDVVETLSYRVYEEEESIVNLFEIVAERIHERRVKEVYVSGLSFDKIKWAVEMIKRCALSPINVYMTNPSSLDEFVQSLKSFVTTKGKLSKVDIKPEDKIQGAHSTIIGGREGREYLQIVAKCEYVKKIVPGVIEAKGTALGGGVRFKVTRCDDKGNIRGLLIDGATVQEIHIITTARNKEEGEVVLKILKGFLKDIT